MGKGTSEQKKREKWARENPNHTRSSWAKEKRQKRLEKRLIKIKKRNENIQEKK